MALENKSEYYMKLVNLLKPEKFPCIVIFVNTVM